MFFDRYEDQFVIWKKFRVAIEKSENPFKDAIKFWSKAPLINKHLDPYRVDNWPTPWDIIKDGKYDDLTVNLMIGHTLRLTKSFTNSQIEIRSYLDIDNKVVYNTCYIDGKILNFPYGEVIEEDELPNTMVLQRVTVLPDYK